ncbi:hypothetical protein [Microtetraspora niveoalba]|uniref:hypothetical protein n=1 Tax=Microtetraspora niveoalba TaxID=46175 RepID=UPI00082DC2EA|nr:hypothetical protein [Microtetraspora niveoalba]
MPLVMLDTSVVSSLLDPGDAAARLRAGDLALRMPDALIIATARGAGARALLSADRKFPGAAPDLVEPIGRS